MERAIEILEKMSNHCFYCKESIDKEQKNQMFCSSFCEWHYNNKTVWIK